MWISRIFADNILWYSAKLLLAGYLVLSGKLGTPLTTILPATTVHNVGGVVTSLGAKGRGLSIK